MSLILKESRERRSGGHPKLIEEIESENVIVKNVVWEEEETSVSPSKGQGLPNNSFIIRDNEAKRFLQGYGLI